MNGTEVSTIQRLDLINSKEQVGPPKRTGFDTEFLTSEWYIFTIHKADAITLLLTRPAVIMMIRPKT